MADLNLLKSHNEARWSAMHVRVERIPEIQRVINRLTAPTAKAAYIEVEQKTGVPWMVVAVIHERESSQRWDRSLAQGDPWTQVSTHVPKGRGPFSSWQEAAIDALKVCPPYAAKWKDWSIGGTLTLLEQYNGLGYFKRGVPSPYIWAATDQYIRGKYVADGEYDPMHIDQQLGCAAMLKAMGYRSIKYEPVILAPTEKPTPPVIPTNPIQSMVNFILRLFRRG